MQPFSFIWMQPFCFPYVSTYVRTHVHGIAVLRIRSTGQLACGSMHHSCVPANVLLGARERLGASFADQLAHAHATFDETNARLQQWLAKTGPHGDPKLHSMPGVVCTLQNWEMKDHYVRTYERGWGRTTNANASWSAKLAPRRSRAPSCAGADHAPRPFKCN